MRNNAYENLVQRRNPDERHIKEAFAKLSEDKAVKYLAGAMEEVDSEYTKNSIEQGNRVWNQIEKGLARNDRKADYRYQGSTTKNTHIKAHSDLDLLVIETRFYGLEAPQSPPVPYTGNPIQDLQEVRQICIDTLTSAFPAATVDSKGPRSVKLYGGSLKRTIDVVPAAWWDTNAYANYGHEFFRGVQILNAHVPTRENDSPFYHAQIIHNKDNETAGNTRKLVRLLKTLRADSEGAVTLSSFDIESLIYRMDKVSIQGNEEQEIQTAKACHDWLSHLENDQALRDSLDVPDSKRKIFAPDKATLAQLTAIRKELTELLNQIEKGLTRSFRKLAEARLKWPQDSPYQNPLYPTFGIR